MKRAASDAPGRHLRSSTIAVPGRCTARRPVRSAAPHPAALAALALALAPALLACPSSPYPESRVDMTPAKRPAPAAPAPGATVLRFAVAAMQSPQETLAGSSRLVERLAERLGTRVELVQRRTYGEVNEMLASGALDAAIVCTGGYVDLERRFPGAVEILALPVIQGKSTYHSYVIVPAASRDRSLADLRGKRFAHTDELSLSGHGYVVHLLSKLREDPGAFFASVQYTRSHDRSIEAVAQGVVDGAGVDSLVFDQLVAAKPWLSDAVRIIDRSPPFAAAPVVASTRLPAARREEIRAALLGLERDPAALPALRLVGFDGFARPTPRCFDSARAVLGAPR